MEPQIKNFKISTKKKDISNNKTITPVIRPLQSKTPLKTNKTQTKSQTPNKNVRKLTSVKPQFNPFLNIDSEVKTSEHLAFLPKITPTITEEGSRVKTEMIEEDKMIVNPNKALTQKPDGNKQMIFLYFRNRIRSLIYSIQRRELAQNIKLELGILLNGLAIRRKTNIREDIILRLIRLISTRSKFKYKDKIDYFKSPILKSINYDIKKRIMMNLQKPQNDENDDEKDHSDEHRTNHRNKSKNVLKQLPSQRNLSTPNSHLIFKQDDNRKIILNNNNLNVNEKVFIVVGGYDDLKDALKARGWIENPNANSLRFDFKWTLKIKDIEYNKLKDNQIVNHFEKNSCLTSKVGVCRNLKNLIGSGDSIDIDEFYPRCYDLEDVNEFEDFIEEFKFTKAEGIIKEFLKINKNVVQLDKNKELSIKIAMGVVCRKIMDVYEKIHQIGMGNFPVILQEEWVILEDLATKHYEKNPDYYGKMLEKYDIFINQMMNTSSKEKEKTFNWIAQAQYILQESEKAYPQYHLNGSRNIWILKPALLSRGRGIKCFNNLPKILDFVFQKKIPYVCQKYIENPLIIKRKKFDIRQWVLVTDWNPLTIWFYEICYVRFSADEYDPNDLNNKFSHLTNNSIAKYSEKFATSDIKGSMWTMEDFAEHVKNLTNRDVFYEKIQPKMKKIVIDVLKSVEDMVFLRKKSMELYGFDFMIDENLNPWIIEINSSPAMDYSTAITEKLVKMVMEDVVRVTLDYAQSKNKKQANTGNFTCIFQGFIKN